LAADIAKQSGCEQCAKDISNAGAAVQKLISDAASKYGYIIVPPGDVGGQIILHILTADSQNETVPIDTTNPPPPTPQTKEWAVTVDCLVQRGSRFDAYSIDEIPNMTEMDDGSIVDVTAKAVCSEYDVGSSKSVTSAKMLLAGEGENPRAKPGKMKYFLIGKAL
jgi:hypothetical protein